jgi:hypothetical protein
MSDVNQTPRWERFHHQNARLAWAQLRVTALHIRDLTALVDGHSEETPPVWLQWRQDDLREAWGDWDEAWVELADSRRGRAETRAFLAALEQVKEPA